MNKSINDATTIEEIAQIEKTFNTAAKNAGWGGTMRVLKDMYKDPTHFLFELLQNAEDTNATRVKMILSEKEFVFMHNGYKFSLEDIKGICKAGDSGKTSAKKGKFGIGFKAVYKITDTPYIYSKDYNFVINDFNVPSLLKESKENELGAIFVLPFNTNLPADKAYAIVEKGLLGLDDSSLMFLDHIEEIELDIKDEKRVIKKMVNSSSHNLQEIKYSKTETSVNSLTSTYHVYQKTVDINGDKKQISLAFIIADEDSEEPISTSKLSVYFPTEQETHLRFRVDAPFETTPTREQVNLNTDFNIAIMQKILDLYERVIFHMRDQGVLSLNLLYQLAINKEKKEDEFYGLFFNKTIDVFMNNDLLLCNDGSYIKASESLLCRDSKLFIELLSTKDLKFLFDDRTRWLDDKELKSIRTDEVRSFLTKSLGVIDFEFNTFNARIKPELFENKDDIWLQKFYEICVNNIQNIKNSPKEIIRTSDNKMKSPFSGYRMNAKPAVYLPSKFIKKSPEVIKTSFIDNENSMAFFHALGIQEADIYDAIKLEWIPFLKSKLANGDDISQVVLEMIKMIESTSSEKKQIIIKDLRELDFIPAQNRKTDEIIFKKADDVYCNTAHVSDLLNGSDAYFLIPELQLLYSDDKQDVKSVLYSLGIKESIKVLKRTAQHYFRLPSEVKKEVKIKYPNLTISDRKKQLFTDYEIEYFKIIVSNLDQGLSVYLWKCLTQLKSECLKSSYEVQFSYHTNIAKGSFPSKLIDDLNKEKWIFINGECLSPEQVTFNDFSKVYPFRNHDLESGLKFKVLEDYSSLDFATKEKIEMTRNFSVDDVKAAIELLESRNREKRLLNMESNYLSNLLVNDLRINLSDNDLKKMQNINEESFKNHSNLELLFNILNKSKTPIRQFNEVSDLKFDPIQYFQRKLGQKLSEHENIWMSSLYEVFCNKENITAKRKFTEELTRYEQYTFDLEAIIDDLEIDFDFNKYYYSIKFLQFSKDVDLIDLSEVYIKNQGILSDKIKQAGLSLTKLDALLNYQSNKSFLFLGEFRELLKRYRSLLKSKDTKEEAILPKDIIIEFQTSITKGVFAVDSNTSQTGTKLDIKKSVNAKSVTGIKAEKIVYKYLTEIAKGVSDVKWKSENATLKINPNGRAGLGYDIQYSKNGKTYYVEVKGTKSSHNKFQLFFSRKEIKFAKKSYDSYQIYLVAEADGKTPKIHQINNLFMNNEFEIQIQGDSFVAEPSGYTVYLELIEDRVKDLT